ncbi:hypothetical protein J7L01_08360, partial [bacterium]|nr:hypothetical protein [bacterium]
MLKKSEKILHGIGVSAGIAIAPAHRIERGEITVVSSKIAETDVDDEIARFSKALVQSRDQLLRIQAGVAKTMGDASAAILEPQIMLMSDVSIVDETESVIREMAFSAESAFDMVMQKGIEAMQSAEDDLMADRAHDLQDVRRRVLSNLMGM